MAVGPQRTHDALLVQRREFGKHLVLFHGRSQRGIIHGVYLRARQHLLHHKPDLAADVAGHEFVVTAEHLDLHTVRRQRSQSRRSAVLGWVQKSNVAQQRERRLVGHRVAGLAQGQLFHGHGYHAQAVLRHLGGDLPDVRQQVRIQRHIAQALAPVHANLGAHRQYLVERAFAHKLVVVIALAHHDRHAPTLKVEWDLIHLAVVGLQAQLGDQFYVLQHCVV